VRLNGNSVKSGREARFRIVIRNPGTAAIENLRYSGFWKRTRIIGDGDPYPFRLTASQGSCSGRSCTLGTVAAGGQVTVEFYGETPAGVLGWYRMTAHAESDNTGSLTQQAEIGTSVTVASSEGGIGSGGGSAGIVFVLALSLLACRRRLLATS
jgi:hypothetical protein